MTAKRTGAKSAKKTAATRGAVQPEELARRRERVRLVRRLSDDEYARLSRDEREELAKKRGAKKLAELAYADFRDWLAGLSSVAGRNCALMEGARRARRAGVDCETFVAETVEAGGEPPLSAGEVRRAYERCKAEPIAPDGVAVRVPFPRPSKPKPRPPSE